jgi:hypothetical protein
LIPGISEEPVQCEVHGNLCLFEGDFVLGHVDVDGNLVVTGLLAQMSAEHTLSASEARRLSIVKDYSAFYWPDGIVRDRKSLKFPLVFATRCWFSDSLAAPLCFRACVSSFSDTLQP